MTSTLIRNKCIYIRSEQDPGHTLLSHYEAPISNIISNHDSIVLVIPTNESIDSSSICPSTTPILIFENVTSEGKSKMYTKGTDLNSGKKTDSI